MGKIKHSQQPEQPKNATPVKYRKTILFLIVCVALWIRVGPVLKNVFIGDQIIFYDQDGYYHLRRVFLALSNSFKISETDSYLSPTFNLCYWPELFDQTIAAVSYILSAGKTNIHTTELVAAWFSPVIGALSVILAYLIAGFFLKGYFPLLTALIFALQPGHISYSRLGNPDHHATEVFVCLFFLYCLLRMANSEEPRQQIFWTIITGISIYLVYSIFPAATIYIGPVFVGIIVSVFISERLPETKKILSGWILSLLVAFLFLLYPCLNSWWGKNKAIFYGALSAFQLYLLLLFIIVSSAIYLVTLLTKNLSGQTRRIWILLAIFTSSAIFTVSFPEFSSSFVHGFRALAKLETAATGTAEKWALAIHESQPLFYSDEHFNPIKPTVGLGLSFLLAPFGILFFGKDILKQKYPSTSVVFLIWSLFITGISFHQWRYCYLSGFVISFLAVYLILHHSRIPKNIFLGFLTIFLALQIYLDIYRLRSTAFIISYDLQQTLLWIRLNTPETGHYLSPRDGFPEYRIMTITDDGHYLIYLARRGAIANPFGVGTEAMVKFYLTNNENDANKIMEANNARYVITTEPLYFVEQLRFLKYDISEEYKILQPYGNYFKISNSKLLPTMSARLHLFDGSRPEIPGIEIPGIGHYRLVYESPNYCGISYFGGIAKREKINKVFEYVRGARCRGFTRPKTLITVSLPLVSNQGREFIYQNKIVADQNGSFEIILPYSTDGNPYPVKPTGKYEISIGPRKYNLAVSEDQVLHGKIIHL